MKNKDKFPGPVIIKIFVDFYRKAVLFFVYQLITANKEGLQMKFKYEMPEIKNPETEAMAQQIAKAIIDADTKTFEELKPVYNSMMDRMVRWEILAFQDRVHYLVNKDK